MWCTFEGGNLDGQVLEIDDDDIDTRFDVPMCSPEQPKELIRSHGMCVYADSGRRRIADTHELTLFEHHADWKQYTPLNAE